MYDISELLFKYAAQVTLFHIDSLDTSPVRLHPKGSLQFPKTQLVFLLLKRNKQAQPRWQKVTQNNVMHYFS